MAYDPKRRRFRDSGDEEYQNCPKCGLPHKMKDMVCSYCGAELSGRVAPREKFNRFVETMKWRYKVKGVRGTATAKSYMGKIVTLIIGAVLLTVGGWLIYRAVEASSFTEFLVGAMFALYGGYAVVNSVKGLK